ncbi:MAG TPA: dTDP-4-dehydrorhamnose reductase [Chitinolyticbacter sp.]|nr:dTDP-4-dehydrorhamnose reductase [Chitinolyticbacter sp.]
MANDAPRLLLTGKDGQLGFELARSLVPLGSLHMRGRAECDLTDVAAVGRMLDHVRPQIIVNAAAYTAVDRAESEPDRAYAVNATAPALLAAWASRHDALLVHYSTDYVFDGQSATPWQEGATAAPLSVYGASKLAGDQAIAGSGCRHLILRTGWVYGIHGGNFVKTILRLATEREVLSVVDDQRGAPTAAALLADVTGLLLRDYWRDRSSFPGGLYHLAAAGETSWHGYAQAIVAGAWARGASLRLQPSEVRPIAGVEYPQVATRPAYSVLDSHYLCSTFGLVLPDWRHHLAHVLDTLCTPLSR